MTDLSQWSMAILHWTIMTLMVVKVSASDQANDHDDLDDHFDAVTRTTANLSNWELNHEQLLHKELLRRYSITGKTARPVKSHEDAVTVRFGLRLIQVDLDEKLQTMTTSAWLRIKWKDAILTWDPKQYGNIETVVLPYDEVWLPDIGHVNSRRADSSYNYVHIRVSYKGEVFWYIQGDFQSACLIDLTDYPFDKHTCDLWFLSHSNSWSHLRLLPYEKSPLDLSTYLSSFRDSQEWQIIGNDTTAYSGSHEVDVKLKYTRKPALRFRLTLERKASFYAFLLLVPSMCLGVLTIMVYAIPPDRPDRTGLAMSLFSSLMLLLLLVVEISPPTASAVPKIAHYYALNLVLIIVTMITSAFVAMLLKRGGYCTPFPNNLQTVCKFAARPLFLRQEANRVFVEVTTFDHNVENKISDEHTYRRLLYKASLSWRLLSRILDRFCMVFHAIFLIVCYIILFPGRS